MCYLMMLLIYLLLYHFVIFFLFFFFKQKTAYEMRISDWSSDVCSSDLFQRIVLIGRRMAAGQNNALDATLAPDEVPIDVAGMNFAIHAQIGRASCRERVCQYV